MGKKTDKKERKKLKKALKKQQKIVLGQPSAEDAKVKCCKKYKKSKYKRCKDCPSFDLLNKVA